MHRTCLASAALLAAEAALVVLALPSTAAPARNLQSKLDAREAKLAKVRYRRGAC